jgi:hypothetical protein
VTSCNVSVTGDGRGDGRRSAITFAVTSLSGAGGRAILGRWSR